MNIILNFIPLKQGGGVQVGLDFLNQAKLYGGEHTWYVVATENTPFMTYEYSDNIKLAAVVKNNLVSRLFFEYIDCKKLITKTKANITYTQFGPTWPGSKLQNIAGCAYSNLMYPEIDFWGMLPLFTRYKRKLIDLLRVKRLLSSDVLIFETQDLAERAIRIFNLHPDRVHFVRPCASSLVNAEFYHEETANQIQQIPSGFRVLLLSHYRPHKNFELLPKIAEVLKNEYQINDVVFVLTLADSNNLSNILSLAAKLNVADNICNIGPITYEGCGLLYKACNAVILPSLLESFSNSIAEAWAMKKPLLISDFDWSRSICENAAIYINYNDASHTAQQIAKLYTDKNLMQEITENGNKILANYSDSKARFMEYLRIIERHTM